MKVNGKIGLITGVKLTFFLQVIAASAVAIAFPAQAQMTQSTNADASASSANTIFGASGPSSTDTTVLVQPTTVNSSTTVLPTGAQNPTSANGGFSCPAPSLSIGGSTAGRLTDQAPFGSVQVAISIPLGKSDCQKGLNTTVRIKQMEAQLLEEGLRQKEFETSLKQSEWQMKLAAQKLALFKECVAVANQTKIAIAQIPGCSAGLAVATNQTAPPPIQRKFVPASDGLDKSFSSDTPESEVSKPTDALKTKEGAKPVQSSASPSDKPAPVANAGQPPATAPVPAQAPAVAPVRSVGGGMDTGLPSKVELDPNNGGIEITVE